jgi:hypothetical protein
VTIEALSPSLRWLVWVNARAKRDRRALAVFASRHDAQQWADGIPFTPDNNCLVIVDLDADPRFRRGLTATVRWPS